MASFVPVEALFVVAAIGAFGQAAERYPAPGRLIDVGGRKIHLFCTGKGSPTVVLLAGGSAFAIDWALVQPQIAKKTRVCSYDRAGLGWSGSGPADETVEQTVSDLHDVLRLPPEKGPFVLVGASIGGIFIRAYQHAFPEEVAALVFTNSTGRVGMALPGGKGGLLWELSEDALRSVFPLPASAKGKAPTAEGEPFDRLPEDLQIVRLWLDVRLWEQFDPAKSNPTSMLSWRKEFLREFDETEDPDAFPLGKLPVVVLASGPEATKAERQTRNTASARLDHLSANSVHLVAKGSGHEIHLYQPDRVGEAISLALAAVRDGKPLN